MKTELTIAEIKSLKMELEGTHSRVGLLKQPLNLSVKFNLLQLYKKASEIVETSEPLEKETIMKYGEDKGEGNFVVETGSPNYETCTKEMEELLNTKHEIEHVEFKMSDFDIQTDEVYPVFLDKLISIGENTN